MELSGRRSFPIPIPIVTLGMTGLAIVASLGVATSAGAVTANSVLKTVKTAIAQQSSVHVAFTLSSGSSDREKISVNVGTSVGQETETASPGNAHLAIKVTPTDAYVSGNSAGLTMLFGFSSAVAKKIGNRWVYWKAGTKQYSSLRTDVTMSSVTGLLPKAKGTKVSTVVKQYVLTWTIAATSSAPKLSNTLMASVTAPALPVTAASGRAGAT